MGTYLEHSQKTVFRERLGQYVIHTGVIIRHYLIRLGIACHGNNRRHMIELSDNVRRRHAV